MGASDFQLGYQAYYRDEELDETRTQQWQNGWLQAEEEEFDGDHDEDMDYGDD